MLLVGTLKAVGTTIPGLEGVDERTATKELNETQCLSPNKQEKTGQLLFVQINELI